MFKWQWYIDIIVNNKKCMALLIINKKLLAMRVIQWPWSLKSLNGVTVKAECDLNYLGIIHPKTPKDIARCMVLLPDDQTFFRKMQFEEMAWGVACCKSTHRISFWIPGQGQALGSCCVHSALLFSHTHGTWIFRASSCCLRIPRHWQFCFCFCTHVLHCVLTSQTILSSLLKPTKNQLLDP